MHTSYFQLEMPAIKQYVIYRQVSGQGPNADVSAMENGEKMVDAKAIHAMSFAKDGNGCVFFSGLVGAEMKKGIYYIVKLRLKLNPGGPAEVVNSVCNCPVGVGPTATCKHVVAMLMTISLFVTKSELLVSGSCTDALQTFKKPPKAHSGAIVPAEALGRGVNDDDDPRPLELRNRPSFMDELHMKTVNFVYETNIDTSWRYTFKKANLKLAMRDHCYLDKPYCYY